MNMAERPIVISFRDELFDGAGCVIFMTAHAAKARMEDANIKSARYGFGVGGNEIVANIALAEAETVQRNAMLGNMRIALAGGKDLYAVGKTEAFCNLAFGIVVSMQHERRDTCLRQSAHLAREKEAGLVVAPVAVIEIAGDNNERDLLCDRLAHEVIKGLAWPCRGPPVSAWHGIPAWLCR